MLPALRELWRYRDLAWILVANDLKLRYRRSVIGVAWTMLNPLLTMLILTAVFSHMWRVHVEKFPVFLLSALLMAESLRTLSTSSAVWSICFSARPMKSYVEGVSR